VDTYTTGSWKPFPGHEAAFVEAWTEFSSWASTMPGAGRAILARDLRDPERFVSFVEWESIDAIRGWKTSPEFKLRMARVQAHIDTFAPTELEVVAVCVDGRSVGTNAPSHPLELAPGGIA
jgi:heme-degrading monooxygenase HmoA